MTVQATLGNGQVSYANSGSGHGNPNNITEPAQYLTVTSQIPNAFSYAGQASSSLEFILTPYALTYTANAATVSGTAPAMGSNVMLSYSTPDAANFINANQIFQVSISGYTSNSASSPVTEPTLQFTSNTQAQTLSQALWNVTGITIIGGRALPLTTGGVFTITVTNTVTNAITGSNTLSQLSESPTPVELLSEANGQTFNRTSTSTPTYSQGNGQLTNVNVAGASGGVTSNRAREYYTFSIGEQPVPQNSVAQDSLGFGIYNTTGGLGQTQLLQMNYSQNGNSNNATYTSTTNIIIPVRAGFITEKGSKVGSISASSDTFQMATAVDQLQFALSTTASNSVISKSSKTFGPYTVGQATNLPNVSIAAVNATPVLSGTSTYTILGVSNLTASTNVASATVPVLLKNLSSSAPLVVLDSNANAGSNLILVGSGYVNTLSAQLESAYNLTGQISASAAPITKAYGGNRILVAGYTAAQTMSAANSFISQLYAQAGSTT